MRSRARYFGWISIRSIFGGGFSSQAEGLQLRPKTERFWECACGMAKLLLDMSCPRKGGENLPGRLWMESSCLLPVRMQKYGGCLFNPNRSEKGNEAQRQPGCKSASSEKEEKGWRRS